MLRTLERSHRVWGIMFRVKSDMYWNPEAGLPGNWTCAYLGEVAHVEEIVELCGGRQHLGLDPLPELHGRRHQ